MELITHGKARQHSHLTSCIVQSAAADTCVRPCHLFPIQVHGKELSLDDLRRVASLAGIKLASA